MKERVLLTKPGSTKEVFHIVIDLAGSNLHFKVGDSLGIYADNDPSLVERIITALKVEPTTPVICPRTQEPMTLDHFLLKKAQISRLTSSFVKAVAPEFLDPIYLETHDIIDFLQEFPHLNLESVVGAFSPLLPRFYSIASSLLTHPDEAHLTVSVSSYMQQNELRYGVASHFLCHLAEVGTTPIVCYVQAAPHFTLPHDDSIPLIMVGPGTGIAPFRGFLQERLAKNASGKHWLFFGERHRSFDFFYEEFWTQLAQEEKLILDLAFSRDQASKVYVQHKLYEKGREIWSWLSQGAHFFLCGEKDPMAKEVEATLLQIMQEFGNHSEMEARAFLKQLRREKKYLADIY
jgi:sulfite reductase (NADPH) flavoprotein alpha-component